MLSMLLAAHSPLLSSDETLCTERRTKVGKVKQYLFSCLGLILPEKRTSRLLFPDTSIHRLKLSDSKGAAARGNQN